MQILCCKVRKVNPINRILPTLDGWITGIRKEHSKNRNSMQMFQIDEQHGGILKINPIIDWSLEQIMEQIRERQIPYNALLDQNYSSIGCAPCTRAIKPGEDLRAGRWWWESQGHSKCVCHLIYSCNAWMFFIISSKDAFGHFLFIIRKCFSNVKYCCNIRTPQ